VVHDVQRPTGLLRSVRADSDLLAVTHSDLVVRLFFDAGHRSVACGHVLLGDGDEVAESRDVAEHADVEGLSSHGLEYLGYMSMRVGRESGWRCNTASHSGVLSLSERQSLRSAMLTVWFK
jgi:hypothetical protein